VHRILSAATLTVHNDHERSMHHQERALALNPNDDLIVVQQGEMLTWFGRAEEGAEWIRKAMRLNPYHPERFWNHLGRAHFVARQYAEAAEAFGHIREPTLVHRAWLAACRAAMGDAAGAAALVRDILAANPNYRVGTHLAMQRYREAADIEHHRSALVRAGLPE
jgi:adenylate cyclase